MGTFSAGQIVFLPFPYSDLTQRKLRPVLAPASLEDWIACQITSNPYADPRAVQLEQSDFAAGSLQRISYLRPTKLFTAHESLSVHTVGTLHASSLAKAREAVVAVVQGR